MIRIYLTPARPTEWFRFSGLIEVSAVNVAQSDRQVNTLLVLHRAPASDGPTCLELEELCKLMETSIDIYTSLRHTLEEIKVLSMPASLSDAVYADDQPCKVEWEQQEEVG